MKKIFFSFAWLFIATNALLAQNLKMYGKYNMEDSAQFNEVVFSESPISFAYQGIDFSQGGKAFLAADSQSVYTTYKLCVTHILRDESKTLHTGDTVLMTVHGGVYTRYSPDGTSSTYGANSHRASSVYFSGIVFCKENKDDFPIAYKNYPKQKLP
jgi:hypothetical protein